MRGRVQVVLAVLLCATVPPLAAQQWTPEQQGLIDHMTQCWDAWVKALADETPDRFFAACPTDPKGHCVGEGLLGLEIEAPVEKRPFLDGLVRRYLAQEVALPSS